MKHCPQNKSLGFTLLEVLVAAGIVALLTAIAVPAYREYVVDSGVADLLEQYAELSEVYQVDAAMNASSLCDRNYVSTLVLKSQPDYPHFPVTLEKSGTNGLVLVIKADTGSHGRLNTEIARRLHESLSSRGMVAPGAVVQDSIVGYSSYIGAVCNLKVAVSSPTTTGTRSSTTPGLTGGTSSSIVAATASPVPSSQPSITCPQGQEAVTQSGQEVCKKICGQGSARNSAGKCEAILFTASQDPRTLHPCASDRVFIPEMDPWDGKSLLGRCMTVFPASNPDPYADLTCQKCITLGGDPLNDPPCQMIHEDVACQWPNNYCVNRLDNFASGLWEVERGCASRGTVFNEWWQGTSDRDKCRRFDENNMVTLQFSCTFGCVGNNCNAKINPPVNTLWRDMSL